MQMFPSESAGIIFIKDKSTVVFAVVVVVFYFMRDGVFYFIEFFSH